IEVAAGEYGNNFFNFKNMLDAKAVDVLQGDITRCGGVTGFLNVASICEKYQVHLSAHCAPALHLHVGPCVSNFRHAEYFYDHVRIENMLFDGVQTPEYGIVYPDLSRPGFGLEFKKEDAEEFKIYRIKVLPYLNCEPCGWRLDPEVKVHRPLTTKKLVASQLRGRKIQVTNLHQFCGINYNPAPVRRLLCI